MVPAAWSQMALNVVASKYFRGYEEDNTREWSVKSLVERVVGSIKKWGEDGGYFEEGESEVFADELKHIIVDQRACFNSPVWFNVGIREKPQCSACFILSVDDNMESIFEWYRNEGIIFKGGSGAGLNVSNLRSSKENLANGGVASGPVSFMKAADAAAGVIRSGGSLRRPAKMVILNADHPDIMEFIKCKAHEEKKAWDLISVGYDNSMDGEAYASVFFQNANNSVRVSDSFMSAVERDEIWKTKYVTTGEVADTYNAKDIFREISKAAHVCGDPGLQFDTTINKWNTCSNTGRINGSNPCSEYVHLDDSACNLASINLLKYLNKNDGSFDIKSFKHTVDVMITAMDIIVSNSSYPTEKIRDNANKFRELGLGYANLGALLMSLGFPYDSTEGRNYAACITSLMTGEGYLQSTRIANRMGPFDGYDENEEPMLNVLSSHGSMSDQNLLSHYSPVELVRAVQEVWDEVENEADRLGVRNSQISVLAPTGTIAFMMDCDTTGVEPDIALVKYKKLVGGGYLKIVNNTVPRSLRTLGYSDLSIKGIVDYILEKGTIEGAPGFTDDDLPVFDCAFKPENGVRFISHLGHIRMMGAVQPFISGAISKTVNLPSNATVEDVEEAYLEAWSNGVKAIAIYRDGSKKTQPLNTSKNEKSEEIVVDSNRRVRLPEERSSITHKFEISGHEGYITVGMYDDGTPGEIFVKMSKEGSTISGLMDSFATAISIALQHGVPLKTLVDKFSHVRFEPSGFTHNSAVPMAKSIIDYIFRWLDHKFWSGVKHEKVEDDTTGMNVGKLYQQDSPVCYGCGSITVRNGSCYKCMNCGISSGCS